MTIATVTEDEFDALNARGDDKPLLLTFSASWCAPCKMMAPLLEDIAGHYGDQVRTRKVDIDASPELGERFSVRGVPTTMMLRGGEEVFRHTGLISKARLAIAIDEVIDPS